MAETSKDFILQNELQNLSFLVKKKKSKQRSEELRTPSGCLSLYPEQPNAKRWAAIGRHGSLKTVIKGMVASRQPGLENLFTDK